MYEAGVLQATDHAWTEGMKEWQTLASLFPALSPPPLPVSAPAVPKAQPAPVHGCLAAVAPVGRSGWALAAGYLGLASILILPAPFAIWFGILAIRDIRRNPHKMGIVRAWFGIVAVSASLLLFLIVVIACSLQGS